MSTDKLRKLYVTEARENVAQLSRALLELESQGSVDAVNAAFRAAHNLKSLAASMGDGASSTRAHALEDRLSRLRDAEASPQPGVVDELLTAVDALESAIESGIENAQPGSVDDATPVPEPRSPSPRLAVRLRADAPLKAARATLIRGLVERAGGLSSMTPSEPADDFDGQFVLTFAPGTDTNAAADLIRSAADVDWVGIPADNLGVRKAAAGGGTRSAAAAEAAPKNDVGERTSRLGGTSGAVRLEPEMLDSISDAVTELAVLHGRLRAGTSATGPLSERMGTILTELRESVLEARMVPVGEAFERFPRLVRDAARAAGKEIDFVIEGEQARLDRSILEGVLDPLTHVLRNAVDHGIEGPEDREAAGKPRAGALTLSAERVRSSLLIEVSDDGRGIDARRVLERAIAHGLVDAEEVPEPDSDFVLKLLAHPGFSLSDQVTELSGRGVGLDVVVERVRRLGGMVGLRSEPGAGTRFTIRLPVTLAMTQALRVRIGLEEYTIPLTHVAEVIELDGESIVDQFGREAIRLREHLVPLIRMRKLLGIDGPGSEAAAVIAELGDRRTAVAVDQLVAREHILVRPMDAPAQAPTWLAGATLGADGRPVLILDPASV